MSDTHAWILSLAPDRRIAVADREMIEYIIAPAMERVPMTPEHCNEVLIHREELLPLFDLNTLLGWEPLAHRRHVGMLAYQLAPRQPLQHLAMYLHGPPVRMKVSDDWVTAVPDYFCGALVDLALSCFTLGDQEVPILNVPYLASANLLDRLLEEDSESAGRTATPDAAG